MSIKLTIVISILFVSSIIFSCMYSASSNTTIEASNMTNATGDNNADTSTVQATQPDDQSDNGQPELQSPRSSLDIYDQRRCDPPYTPGVPSSLKVFTDKIQYQPGQIISTYVDIKDKNGCFTTHEVNLIFLKMGSTSASSKELIVSQTPFVANPYDPVFQTQTDETGSYGINVSLVSTDVFGNNILKSSTVFKSVAIYQTLSAQILIVAIASFAGLMIVTGLGNKFENRTEVLRFIFISAIIFSVIASFAFLEDPIGTNSPVGLTKRFNGEWVITIGGNNLDYSYQAQNEQSKYVIQIPVYVVIFGIIGGYLRYLYSKSIPILRNDSESSLKNENNFTGKKSDRDKKLNSFYISLGEIALLFLAPVLAIAIYFMLNIIGVSGQNSIYVIGVLSIGIGLVTQEAIDVIIRFAKSKFEEDKKEETPTPDTQDKTEETPTPDTQDKTVETPTPDTQDKTVETTTPDTQDTKVDRS